MSRPSINALTAPLVASLIEDAEMLRLGVERLENGCLLVDAGIHTAGSLEAGRRIAEICLGGLGSVSLSGSGPVAGWPLSVHVHTVDPVLACLGSQYAGWSLSHREAGKKGFNALASGPGRALSLKEPLFKELDYQDRAERTCLVLEVDRLPPLPLCEKIARDCAVDVKELTLILTPTSSLAGTVQIVARVLEVAMHKAHELGFDLHSIRDGIGSAPLPPPAPDLLAAMGRTNDAILFAGQVQLFVSGEDAQARKLASDLPSSASRDYGRPFGEIFKAYDYDFFKIDPMLFSPARVMVSALDSGNSYSAGDLDTALLTTSFGIGP
ncbi:MAG: methenyltetrahydromethanopterin cyclohydrolase [gamma proteobacterium symbiont of Ctena orbiculata]|nr:methenyltetrahydromethanopterin cyclohydrolase [Candidatus Thiodiazotropha taylori]PUB86061.1 MAG: methenyltetrahydromethanopterin cyclohydrolase [gamma proteobacterium symbiont of Ctena orbiculata]MBT2996530.1 methenyltetrahydromethanopterin cyclohydrolase [Candidatus Thiodiazotropha taylori]MBT3000570.1 methenyltetrahydromethanopterin cyclohydrolase [Candidatus Thiodiazotropha taylori]MBT3026790.1 methenyltetrahydromethanopterin cyclohydrolase [Candidatus Thiodiazotropha taylori]